MLGTACYDADSFEVKVNYALYSSCSALIERMRFMVLSFFDGICV
jgi:hypothetical protein